MDETSNVKVRYFMDHIKYGEELNVKRQVDYGNSNWIPMIELINKPAEELNELKEKSILQEQNIYNQIADLVDQWNDAAAKTASIINAIEYLNIEEAKHNSNIWEVDENGWYRRSNKVYKMCYNIYEHTKYESELKKLIPEKWSVSWYIILNLPVDRQYKQIAGQNHKVFKDKTKAEKYMQGRINAYEKLFTEINPVIPAEYSRYFKFKGCLLPGYMALELCSGI